MEGAGDGKVSMRRPFDPAAHDLDPSFRLTRFADLKGWGCKVPQEVLLKLLEGLQQDSSPESEQAHFQYVAAAPKIGKWLLFQAFRQMPVGRAPVEQATNLDLVSEKLKPW